MGPPSDGTSSSSPGVFVTGTGTEVGKTVVAAAIARTLAAEGHRVTVFKPAVTGLDEFPADGPKSRAPSANELGLIGPSAGSRGAADGGGIDAE